MFKVMVGQAVDSNSQITCTKIVQNPSPKRYWWLWKDKFILSNLPIKFEFESHELATQRFFCFDTGALCDFARNKISAAKVLKKHDAHCHQKRGSAQGAWALVYGR